MEVSKRANKWIKHNARGGANLLSSAYLKLKCSTSRREINLSLQKQQNFPFLLLCPAVLQFLAPQLFRSPPDPACQWKQLRRAQISKWRLGMSRTAANHVEVHFDDHSDDKKVNLKYIFNKEKMQIFNDELTRFLRVKDRFPNISSVTSEMGVTTRSRVCSTFSALTFDWRIGQCWNLVVRYKTGKWGKYS